MKVERAHLTAAQTVAKMGSWDTDLSTHAVVWSAETYRIFEVVPGDFRPTHTNFLDHVHPEDRAAMERAFDQSLDQRGVNSLEHRLLMPDGRIKFVEEQWQIFHDEQGRALRALGTCRDITERKQAEAELRWKTAFLEAQVGASIDGIIVVDPQGRKILQNQRTIEIFKIPPHIADDKDDSAQLQWVTSMVADPAPFVARVQHLYAHLEEIGRDEVELKDGTVLDRYSSPVTGDDGQYYGRIWAFRDITAARRAENALRESEERFRQIAETIQEVFWITDAARQQMLYISPAYERIWGRSCTSLQNTPQKWFTAIHTDDRERVLHAVATQQTDGTYDEEYRIIRPDGSLRWIRDRAFPVRNATGEIYRVVGVAQDITERKRSRDLLREQASLLDKARDAILVRHLERGVTFWNKSAESLYGWTAEEVKGRQVSDFLYRDLTVYKLAMEAVLSHGEWTGDLHQVTKAGDPILIEARWTLVRDEAGRPQAVLAINSDITEKKKMEQQFLRAQRMESIGTLAGGIAHDLNNVLAPILMSIDLLRLTNRDERSKAVLSTIETSAKRGAHMVKQILSFARGVEGERMTINVRHIIEDMQHLVQDTFPKDIIFRAQLTGDLPLFYGDHTQVHQVLLNLCVNARDAMPRGGTLTVTAYSLQVDSNYAGMTPGSKPGRHLMIKVTDTGTGIPPEVVERIFDPFFTTKELGKGTGLGLSTVLSIVKSHDGFINVYSEPGNGTTFSVCFPAMDAPEGAAAKVQEDTHPRGNGELILIVDDEAAVRTITQQTLETYGYRVLGAADGTEAVALYSMHRKEIAAVVTDMMMPVMGGQATIQVLQRLNPAVKVIAASGLANDGSAARSAAMGVKHFLPKPFTAQTILTALDQVLHDRP